MNENSNTSDIVDVSGISYQNVSDGMQEIVNSTTKSSVVVVQTNYFYEAGKVQIPLYSTIFLLAVIGNSLVILTLVQNKRMRTITNLFLLNLAVSDIFIGVFCMPFTLVGTLLRDFIFGEFMCKLLPYLQGDFKFISMLLNNKLSRINHILEE